MLVQKPGPPLLSCHLWVDTMMVKPPLNLSRKWTKKLVYSTDTPCNFSTVHMMTPPVFGPKNLSTLQELLCTGMWPHLSLIWIPIIIFLNLTCSPKFLELWLVSTLFLVESYWLQARHDFFMLLLVSLYKKLQPKQLI